MAETNGDKATGQALKEKLGQVGGKVQDSQTWAAIFRPGSIFRKGYTDSPRNRSYVIMNSVLYHLHPVKVKRHAVKVSYTLCLGGLSFFLFIFLTVTGIFLMFSIVRLLLKHGTIFRLYKQQLVSDFWLGTCTVGELI